ncbi:MAG: hypothetical protein ABII22_01645, partial [Candidatus Micrarchaeota archaeon]
KSGTTVTASDKDGTKKYADKCEGNLVRSYNCDGSNVVENPVECEANQFCQNRVCVAATCDNGGVVCAAGSFCSNGQCVAASCEEFEDGYKVIEVSASGRKEYVDTCNSQSVIVDYSCSGSRAIPTYVPGGNGKYCVKGRWVDDPSTCTNLDNGINVKNQSWGSRDYANTCDGNRIVGSYVNNPAYTLVCGPNGGYERVEIAQRDCGALGQVCSNGACVSLTRQCNVLDATSIELTNVTASGEVINSQVLRDSCWSRNGPAFHLVCDPEREVKWNVRETQCDAGQICNGGACVSIAQNESQ